MPDGTDRQTGGQTLDRCFMLFATNVVSVIKRYTNLRFTCLVYIECGRDGRFRRCVTRQIQGFTYLLNADCGWDSRLELSDEADGAIVAAADVRSHHVTLNDVTG